jgi:hypothetical protein
MLDAPAFSGKPEVKIVVVPPIFAQGEDNQQVACIMQGGRSPEGGRLDIPSVPTVGDILIPLVRPGRSDGSGCFQLGDCQLDDQGPP